MGVCWGNISSNWFWELPPFSTYIFLLLRERGRDRETRRDIETESYEEMGYRHVMIHVSPYSSEDSFVDLGLSFYLHECPARG